MWVLWKVCHEMFQLSRLTTAINALYWDRDTRAGIADSDVNFIAVHIWVCAHTSIASINVA